MAKAATLAAKRRPASSPAQPQDRDVFVLTEGTNAQPYPGAKLRTYRLATIAVHAVHQAFGVDAIWLRAAARGDRRVAAARQYAIALVHLVTGRSQSEVAKCFTRNRTTASNHMEMVEALNDVREHEDFWRLMEARYRLLVQLAELGLGQHAWREALRGIDRSLDNGDLEGQAYDQALYIRGTFDGADHG
jgi:hypothetical protein